MHPRSLTIRTAGLLCLLLATASAAWANSGTPLEFPTVFPLVLANLVIGVLEGAVLGRIYRSSVSRAIGIMVLANGFSATVGFIAMGAMGIPDRAFSSTGPLHNDVRDFALFAAPFAFVVSIFLEWPFCIWFAWGRPSPVARGLGASALAQVASHLALALLFVATLFVPHRVGSFRVDNSVVRNAPDIAQVFYRHPFGGTAYRSDLAHRLVEQVPGYIGYWPRSALYFRRAANGQLDLRSYQRPSESDWQERDSLILADLGPGEVADRDCTDKPDPNWLFGIATVVADLRHEDEKAWDVSVTNEGLQARNRTSGKTLWFPGYFVTVVSRDYAIAKSGGQIGLLDLANRRVGYFARGVAPIVMRHAPGAGPPLRVAAEELTTATLVVTKTADGAAL